MGHHLLMLCSFAALSDGICGFAVDLPRQKKHMVNNCPDYCAQPPNFYPTTHAKKCKISFYSLKDDHDKLLMSSPMQIINDKMLSNPSKSIYFSLSMILCGAALGPFLDSYHSLFGVLTYNNPVIVPILVCGDEDLQLIAYVTTYWVPPLFGLAGFLIGWLYILLDASVSKTNQSLSSKLKPTTPKVLIGVAYDRPLIEVGLISFLPDSWAYRYNNAGETIYFPLWIVPVYFLGGPANGNLARAIRNVMGKERNNDSPALPKYSHKKILCLECNSTRAISCPNCDDGTYVTYGKRVICKACRGKGRVICRTCFSQYGNDPNDIESIRQLMDKIPD